MLPIKRPTATGAKIACGLMLFLSLLLLALALGHEQAERQHNRRIQAALASQQLAEILQDNLQSVDLAFDLLNQHPYLEQLLEDKTLSIEDEQPLLLQLRASLLHAPLLGRIQIVNSRCQVVLDTASPPSAILTQRDLCFWLRNKGRRIDRRYTAIIAADGGSDIIHAVKLQDTRHTVIGMAIATLPEAAIMDAMAGIDAGAHGERWIQDRHQHLLLQPRPTGSGSLRQQQDAYAQLPAQEQPDASAASPLDRQARAYSIRQLENYPLRVAVGRSAQDDGPAFSMLTLACLTLWLLLMASVLYATRKQLRHITQTERLIVRAKAQHAGESQMMRLLAALPVAAILVEQHTLAIRFSNRPAQALLDLPPEEELVISSGLDAENRLDIQPLADWLHTGRQIDLTEVEIETHKDTRQWVWVSIVPVLQHGQTMSLVLLQDRSEIKSLQHALQEKSLQLDSLSGIDPLTQLENRQAAEQALRHEIGRCQRYGQPMTLVFFDLDHFSEFNQRHGRQAGDNVLISVAQELKRHTRTTDVCARMGGEEFMVIFTNTPLAQAFKVMDRIREKMAHTILPMAQECVSFSGGITAWQLGDTPEEMELRVEGLLRQAKSNGRNRLQCDD